MSIEIVDARYHKELSVLKGLVEEHFRASLSMNKQRVSVIGARGIHPQHDHTGIPDQSSTGRTRWL